MTRPTSAPNSRALRSSSNGNGNAAAAPVLDRTAELFDHADDANDVVQFYEADPVTNKWRYLERIDLPDVRAAGVEEFVKQRYGGGKFKAGLRGRTNGVYGKSVVFEVAGPPKSAADRDAARGITAPTPAAAAPVVAARGMGGMSELAEKLLLLIGVPVATAFGTQLAKKLLEPKQTDPVLLELMKQLGKTNAGAPSTASPLDHIKTLQSLLELQDSLAERASSGGSSAPVSDTGAVAAGGGIAGAIERQLPALVNLLNRKIDMDERRATRASQPPRVQAPPAPPAPVPVPSSSSPSSPSSSSPADPLVMLLSNVPGYARSFLLNAAESDENPAVYGDLILGKLDDDSYAALAEQLERPEFVDVFCQIMPAFGQYRPWVEELAAAMREAIASAAAELGANETGPDASPTHSGDSSSSSAVP